MQIWISVKNMQRIKNLVLYFKPIRCCQQKKKEHHCTLTGTNYELFLCNLISQDRPIIFAHQSDLQQPFIKDWIIKLPLTYRDFCRLWTDFSLDTDCIFCHKCLTWHGGHVLCSLLCCLLERVITGQLVTLQQELLQWSQWLSDSSVIVWNLEKKQKVSIYEFGPWKLKS